MSFEDEDEVTQMVNAATSDMLFAPDWEANLLCVDTVLNTIDGPELAVSAIRERLKSNKEEVVLLAFELLDCLLKNVYEVIHLVGQREVIDEIMKIAEGKMRKASEKALDFIQYFADAFKMIPLLYYGYAFNQLAQRGCKFPPPREEEYVMPQKREIRASKQEEKDLALAAALSAEESRARHVAAAPASSSGTKPIKHLRKKLESISENVILLREMLGSLGPTDRPQENELFQELIPKAQEFQKQLVQTIENDAASLDETLLGLLLATNDSLAEVLKMYDAAVEKTLGDTSKMDARTKSKLKHDPRFAVLPARNATLDEPAGSRSRGSSGSSKPVAVSSSPPAAPAKPTSSPSKPGAMEDLLFGMSDVKIKNTMASEKAGSRASTAAAPADDPFDEFAVLATRKRPDSGTFVAPPTTTNPSTSPLATAAQPKQSLNPFDLLAAQPVSSNQPPVNQTVAPNPFLDLLGNSSSVSAAPQSSTTSASKPAATSNDLIQW